MARTKIIGKMLVKQHLRAELKNPLLTADQVANIKAVLNSRHMLGALQSRVMHAYGDTINGAGFGKLGDGVILKFLWDHREEILKFIQEIVKLFS